VLPRLKSLDYKLIAAEEREANSKEELKMITKNMLLTLAKAGQTDWKSTIQIVHMTH
jgi:hypothetical protein